MTIFWRDIRQAFLVEVGIRKSGIADFKVFCLVWFGFGVLLVCLLVFCFVLPEQLKR